MRCKFLKCLICFACIAAAATIGAREAFAAPEIAEQVQLHFGILATDRADPAVAQETLSIPRKDKASGFRYGITFDPPNEKPYYMHLILGYPSTPGIQTGDVANAHVNPATNQIRTPSYRAAGKWTLPMWFDTGDPLGDYTIEVFINGHSVRTITYRVFVPDAAEH